MTTFTKSDRFTMRALRPAFAKVVGSIFSFVYVLSLPLEHQISSITMVNIVLRCGFRTSGNEQ